MSAATPEWFEGLGHPRPLGLTVDRWMLAGARLPFRALHGVLSRSTIARMLFFETAPEPLMVGGSPDDGAFVVSTRDRGVGRFLYAEGRQDFDKAERAMSLAGVTRGETVLLDIGANVGSICIPFVKRGFGRAAIAIEPEPDNFQLLSANIALNSLGDRITALNCALGERAGVLELALSAVNSGDHRALSPDRSLPDTEHDRPVVQVPATTLDEVVAEHGDNQLFLWMDTQGYEGYILAGGTDTLARRFPLVLEFWPYAMAGSGSYARLCQALGDAGYRRFYRLGETRPQAIPLTTATLDALYAELSEDGPYTDILVL